MAKRAVGRAAKARAAKGKRRSAGAVPWRRIPEAALVAARERLTAAGYAEAGIAGRLGVAHPIALSLDRYAVYEARLAARTPLDVAIAVFLLQGEAARDEVEALLGPEVVAALLEQGLLEVVGRGRDASLAAAVSLYPCAGGLFATDHRWRPTARHERRAPAEPVMYLGGDSYGLAYLAPRRPVGGVLDLCTGSGVHAVLAARHATRVTAVDLSPRALGFGKLNAAMNGVADRITWLRGDLYAPLPDGEPFDLVLANPPFVPTPHMGRARIGFRDGGETGEEVLARIVAGLPGRLARDGTAAIVSIFAEAEDEPYPAKLARWLPRRTELARERERVEDRREPAGATPDQERLAEPSRGKRSWDYGALLLRFGSDAPAEYAQGQTRRAFGDTLDAHRARHARWVETIRRAGIRRLSGGVLALRPHAGPTPPWWRTLDVAWPTRPVPTGLEREWRACDAAHAMVFLDELLDRPARAAADLVLTDEVERPEPGAPLTPRRHRARAASSLGPEVGVSPELRALLSAADGSRTFGSAIEELAGAAGVEPRELAERLLPDLLELAERGLLVLDKA